MILTFTIDSYVEILLQRASCLDTHFGLWFVLWVSIVPRLLWSLTSTTCFDSTLGGNSCSLKPAQGKTWKFDENIQFCKKKKKKVRFSRFFFLIIELWSWHLQSTPIRQLRWNPTSTNASCLVTHFGLWFVLWVSIVPRLLWSLTSTTCFDSTLGGILDFELQVFRLRILHLRALARSLGFLALFDWYHQLVGAAQEQQADADTGRWLAQWRLNRPALTGSRQQQPCQGSSAVI